MSPPYASRLSVVIAVCALGFGAVGSAHAQFHAVEWSNGSVINLNPPGSTISEAAAINDSGQVVGSSSGGATEWNNGSVIYLGGLPGSAAIGASAINDAGQVVGIRSFGPAYVATEWSNGSVINLGFSNAFGINNAGQVVGVATGVPEPSTWAMMLTGFAGLGFLARRGWRRTAIA